MPNKKTNLLRKRASSRQSHWRESLMAVMQPAIENPLSSEINVGAKLQELRNSQGLSLRSLAEISGLNFNTLSLIENEKTSPNVSTLQQLATALRVPITAFFENTATYREVVFQKNGQRPLTMLPHGGLEDMGGGLALGEATPLLMTCKPGSNSGLDEIVHTGQEFIYCLDGNLVYRVGQHEYILEQGDSLIFQAHIPHCWENRGEKASHCILILCPSDSFDRSVRQHLNDQIEEQN
jgi:DNA-binding XRE family transcriptional regulator